MRRANYCVHILGLTCVWISIILSTTAAALEKRSPQSYTTITTKNFTEPSSYIDFKIVQKPHHLYIGRCHQSHKQYHAENIVVQNDGTSHVSADIRINIEGPVYITCAKILDQIPNGEGGYPHYIGGGVGHNYIEFSVTTTYGKGFSFYVEVFGYDKGTEKEDETNL